MKEKISFQTLQSDNDNLVELISGWYFKEWNIPVEYTKQRLTNIPNDDVLFQLILFKNDEPIATGGLYLKVGLLKVHPKYNVYHPWLALLYTSEGNRNLGYGGKLLSKIEKLSVEMGFNELFLHTITAESLYLRNNWESIERVPYKNKITVVMKKKILNK